MLFLSVACAAQMQILKVLKSMSNTPKDPETIALQNACLTNRRNSPSITIKPKRECLGGDVSHCSEVAKK